MNPLPNVGFQIDESTLNQCISTEQLFSNHSTIPSEDLTFQWSFGDGGISNEFEPVHLYPEAGEFTVTLTATSTSTGCNRDYSTVIEVLPEANAQFSYEDKCFGQSVEFMNFSNVQSGNLFYSWDFGDGTSSNLENPTKLYSSPGSYLVNLEVLTEDGCVTVHSEQVEVFEQPIANFIANDVCFADSIEFENVSLGQGNFHWNFDDGSISEVENPTHDYEEAGIYSVSLSVVSDQGCSDSLTREIEIYHLPNPSFSVDNVCQIDPAIFKNNSQIKNGTLDYHWDFDDGTTSSDSQPNHRYQSDGVYMVRLTAISEHGCESTFSDTLQVYEQPIAQFDAMDVCADSAVSFTNESIGDELAFRWKFGDGKESSLSNPVHYFPGPGSYHVQLEVNTDHGCTGRFEDPINIYPLPTSTFLVQDECEKDSVQFNNASSIPYGSLQYLWDFGDNSNSTEKSPIHVYDSPGSYITSLLNISEHGCQDYHEVKIQVNPRPVAAFITDPVCHGELSLFNNKTSISNGQISEYSWDFGDGTNSIVENPEKLYLNPGSYEVNLIVKSQLGCENSISKLVDVFEYPVVDFQVVPVCHKKPISLKNLSSINSGAMEYLWDFGDGASSNNTHPVHVYDRPGIYTIELSVVSSTGCVDSITKDVEIFRLPTISAGDDIVLSKGFTETLIARGANKYIWSPSYGLDNNTDFMVEASPGITTTYSVLGIDENGCRGTDSVIVYVENDQKLIANNVFTPDGNGLNDTWVIRNIETYGNAVVRVFNRFGQLVFEQESYKNDWQGTFNGDILPDGTYYYLISFTDSDLLYKGAITLIRD